MEPKLAKGRTSVLVCRLANCFLHVIVYYHNLETIE